MIPFVPIGPAPDYPSETDVRSGVDYDFGNLTGSLDGVTVADIEDARDAILEKLPAALINGRIDASVGTIALAAKRQIEHSIGKYHNVREWPIKNDDVFKSPIASDNNFATWPGLLGPAGASGNEFFHTYTALDGSNKTCLRAESLGTDINNLTPSGSPVTILSADQVYDAGGLFLSSAGEISGSTVRLYYCGTPSANANHQICLATCPKTDILNPASWTKQGVMIAWNDVRLPAALQQGIEPTGYLEWGGWHWLYICSVPNGNRPVPTTFAKVILTDRRACVVRSSSATDWSAAEFRMLLAETDQPSRVQPYRYMISFHAFVKGTASNAPIYGVAACDATNTDHQRGVIFSSPDPWFDAAYTQEEFTFLLTRDNGTGWPDGEIDVFSLLTTNSSKNVLPSNKFRMAFGGRNLNGTWSCGMIELDSIDVALTPGHRGAAHNVQRMLGMRAGSTVEERSATQAVTVATNLNATVSSRLESASYTAPDNATIATGAAAAASAASSAGTAATNTATILARIGAFTGTGLNTILGFLRALAAKASGLTPSDLATGTTFDNTTDSQEAIADNSGGQDRSLLVYTTIDTLTSQTVFTLTVGPENDNALKDSVAVITSLDGTKVSRVPVSAYIGSGLQVALSSAPAFTISAGDLIACIASGSASESAESSQGTDVFV